MTYKLLWKCSVIYLCHFQICIFFLLWSWYIRFNSLAWYGQKKKVKFLKNIFSCVLQNCLPNTLGFLRLSMLSTYTGNDITYHNSRSTFKLHQVMQDVTVLKVIWGTSLISHHGSTTQLACHFERKLMCLLLAAVFVSCKFS